MEDAEEKAAKSLCRVLKDFNWNYAVTLSRVSVEIRKFWFVSYFVEKVCEPEGVCVTQGDGGGRKTRNTLASPFLILGFGGVILKECYPRCC